MLGENMDLTAFLILLLYKLILTLAGLKKPIFHLTGCKHGLEADKQFKDFADCCPLGCSWIFLSHYIFIPSYFTSGTSYYNFLSFM